MEKQKQKICINKKLFLLSGSLFSIFILITISYSNKKPISLFSRATENNFTGVCAIDIETMKNTNDCCNNEELIKGARCYLNNYSINCNTKSVVKCGRDNCNNETGLCKNQPNTISPPPVENPTPSPTFHVIKPEFLYLPKPGYSAQPKNCFTIGCAQPANGCFVSCRDGVLDCKEYLKKDNISTSYNNNQYLCQNYWILPSSIPTQPPASIPTKVPPPTPRLTPTPEPYEKIITKYSTWIVENNLTDCILSIKRLCGPVLDLTPTQTAELHDFFNSDTTNNQIKQYVFSVINDGYNSIETSYVTQDNNGQTIKIPYKHYLVYNKTNEQSFIIEQYKNKLYDATFNPLYMWKIYGYGLAPNYAWPYIFGVDENKSFVFYAAENPGVPINILYPIEPGIPDSERGKIQKVFFSTYQNKIFIYIPSVGSFASFWEIYKNTEGNILFRGIWLRDIFSPETTP
ncbi:MAG: hypothetical protein AAB929_02480 [Patescibacteria group bacterium]